MTAFTPESVLGIDMAKAKADTQFLRVGSTHKPLHRIYDNTPAGHDQLLTWLATQHVGQLHVCLEATGTYGDALASRLHQAGYRVSMVNPLRIKRYGESELLRIKSDKTDAALIARFCLTQHPDPWTPPRAEWSQLQDLVRSLQDLQQMHQQQANRQQSGPHSESVTTATTAVLSCLQTQMSTLRERIEQHILAHRSLSEDYELVLSICGIGKTTAALLLAELGDIRRFANVRELVAYVGLSPHPTRSGTSVHGPSPLSKRGHASVRKALYFPAISAARHNPAIKALYQRLLARGKPKMVALAAAMRKLVHQIYGVLRSNQPFDSAHVSVRPVRPAASH
jgi:transposase